MSDPWLIAASFLAVLIFLLIADWVEEWHSDRVEAERGKRESMRAAPREEER